MASAEQIAELWATQAPKGPKRAGNFWRDGVRAGHHASCVAQLLPGANGELVALIWDSHWGNGTAMFLNLCGGKAKAAGITAFRVPGVTAKDHAGNLAFFEAKAQECEAKIPRAKSIDWQAHADRFREQAALYRATFGIDAKQAAAA